MKVHIGPYRKNRKVSVKIDDYDLWSLDSTLTEVILPALKAFRERSLKGVPGRLYDEAKTDEENAAAWKAIIDEMIWTFDEILNETTGSQITSWNNFEEYKKVQDKIDAGLHLFAEYFTSLWD